jgi:Holliday junction resolvasome RuvABC endonuclease subunit
LDISTLSTGWAVLEFVEERATVLDRGVILNDASLSLGAKLAGLNDGLIDIFSRNRDVKWVAVEDTYNNNTITMKTLSKCAGVAILNIFRTYNLGLCYTTTILEKMSKARKYVQPERGIYVMEPTEILKAVGFKGRMEREEKKQAVIDWVVSTFKLPIKTDEDDVADAIAIAMACGIKLGLTKK